MASNNNVKNNQSLDSNESKVKKIYISWQEIEDLINSNLTKIKNVKDIYPIPRGGLVIGVMLSHKLNLPFANKITKHTLVVDEICDSGKTFIELEEKLGFKLNTFCLHRKSIAKYSSDIVCKELTTPDWIVYPWEV